MRETIVFTFNAQLSNSFFLTILSLWILKFYRLSGDKLGIVDVKVKTKSGKIIDIEIQINPVKNIGRRLSFYKSKLIVEQIGEAQHYSVIQRVICICITDYVLFPGVEDYLNNFRFYNRKNGLCFEDIPEEVYTLELPTVA